ncbi:MAG: hypothetical protein NT015_06025 [Alphaproteobacteria bacterium]|nr:hypothetical protein [Alphaproteobacteria bacterium]
MARGATDGTVTLAITGHRLSHQGMHGRAEAVGHALKTLFDLLTSSPVGARSFALNTMLADGADQIATRCALALGWRVNATLPFGAALTCAIGATSNDDSAEVKRGVLEQARHAIASRDRSENAAIQAFSELLHAAHVETPSDDDAHDAALWIGDAPSFLNEASQRYAMAARLALDNSDVLVAVWDGASTDLIGGTGDTVIEALKLGLPVIWIEPAAPETVRLLTSATDLSPPRVPFREGVALLATRLRTR